MAEAHNPKNTSELIAILEEEVRLRKANRQLVRAGGTVLVAGLFAFWAFLWLTQAMSFPSFLSNYGAFFLVALGGVALSSRHRQALLQIERPDPRLAGYLVEALSYRDHAVVRHAEALLAKLLPTVTELTLDHSAMLAERIVQSQNRAFVMSALMALRRFGGARCLEFLDDIGKARSGATSVAALEASAEIRLRLARRRIDEETESVAHSEVSAEK